MTDAEWLRAEVGNREAESDREQAWQDRMLRIADNLDAAREALNKIAFEIKLDEQKLSLKYSKKRLVDLIVEMRATARAALTKLEGE